MTSLARKTPQRPSSSEGQANGTPDRVRSQAGSPLDPDLQSLIGEKLRLFYADLLTDPVPDRFVQLLDQLEKPKGNPS